MDPQPARPVGPPARRTDILMLLFLVCLLITVVCLRAVRDTPTTEPAPEPATTVEYAAAR